MPNFRRLLSRRRLLAVLGIAALVFGPLMLHPYPRQSLFGPTIRGKAWCVWEEQVRKEAHAWDQRGWLSRLIEEIGLLPEDIPFAELHAAGTLPLWLHLADDPDEKVRRASIRALEEMAEDNPDEVLPILRRHLDDTDPFCRLYSAGALWSVSHDHAAITAILSLKNHRDKLTRKYVSELLFELVTEPDARALSEPDVFTALAAACEDADAEVRMFALGSMIGFGKRGVAVLRKALRAPELDKRVYAMAVVVQLGPDGASLRPEIAALANDPDPNVSRVAAVLVQKIDAKNWSLHEK